MKVTEGKTLESMMKRGIMVLALTRDVWMRGTQEGTSSALLVALWTQTSVIDIKAIIST